VKIDKPVKADQKKIDEAKEAARIREEKISRTLTEALRNKRAKE